MPYMSYFITSLFYAHIFFFFLSRCVSFKMQAATTLVEHTLECCVTANLEFYLLKEKKSVNTKYVFQKGIRIAVAAADDRYYVFIPDKICFDWLQLLLCQFRVTVLFRCNFQTYISNR